MTRIIPAIDKVFGKGSDKKDKKAEAQARKAEKASRRGYADYHHGLGSSYWDDEDYY